MYEVAPSPLFAVSHASIRWKKLHNWMLNQIDSKMEPCGTVLNSSCKEQKGIKDTSFFDCLWRFELVSRRGNLVHKHVLLLLVYYG